MEYIKGTRAIIAKRLLAEDDLERQLFRIRACVKGSRPTECQYSNRAKYFDVPDTVFQSNRRKHGQLGDANKEGLYVHPHSRFCSV